MLGLKTSRRDGPKTAGAWGPLGPGGWQSKPGAMLRRRERTAHWRRVRGGGRAPPRSRGPGTEDCSKTLSRLGVFSALSKMESSWQPTAPTNTRLSGTTRGAALAAMLPPSQQLRQLEGKRAGLQARLQHAATGKRPVRALPAQGPTASSFGLQRPSRGRGLCPNSPPAPARLAAHREEGEVPASVGQACPQQPTWAKRRLGAGARCPPALGAQGGDAVPRGTGRAGGSGDLPVPCPAGLRGTWAGQGTPSPHPAPATPRDDPRAQLRRLPAPAPTARPRLPSPAQPRLCFPDEPGAQPQHRVLGSPTTALRSLPVPPTPHPHLPIPSSPPPPPRSCPGAPAPTPRCPKAPLCPGPPKPRYSGRAVPRRPKPRYSAPAPPYPDARSPGPAVPQPGSHLLLDVAAAVAVLGVLAEVAHGGVPVSDGVGGMVPAAPELGGAGAGRRCPPGSHAASRDCAAVKGRAGPGRA